MLKETKKKPNMKILCFSFSCLLFFFCRCSFILFMCDNFCHKDMGEKKREKLLENLLATFLGWQTYNAWRHWTKFKEKKIYTNIYIYEMETHDLSYSLLLHMLLMLLLMLRWLWSSSKWWWRRSIKELCCTKITWKDTLWVLAPRAPKPPYPHHFSLHYPLLFPMKWCWKIANIRFQTC